jgi:hypothetical protein
VSVRPCCGKLSLQFEEGRISFQDLGVDLGAETFGALSDVHGSIGRYGISWGVEGQNQGQGRAPHAVKLALGSPRHPLSAAQTV